MAFNLATILRESAHSHPDKTALISGTERMSYAELDAASDRPADYGAATAGDAEQGAPIPPTTAENA